MKENTLTTQETWEKYWQNKTPIEVGEKYAFYDIFQNISSKLKTGSHSIELGGFPGYFSVYLKKYCKLNVTLLDYYYSHSFFSKMLSLNKMANDDIEVLKEDIFSYNSVVKYDFVFSCGLIEHFYDLNGILKEHIKFVNEAGIVLIIVPNFLGINGLIQKYFDPQNLSIHNLEAMNLNLIKESLIKLGLAEIDSGYYPSFQVWVEGLQNKGFFINILIRIMNRVIMPLLSILIGKKNKFISNSTYWVFQKNKYM
jgi:hypothetical protein